MMRKRLIPHPRDVSAASQPWLDVAALAQVELTTEDPACPIDAALRPVPRRGGGPPSRARRGSGSCLITPKRCTGCGSSSPNRSRRAAQGSSCGGPPTAASPTGRSSGSSIPLAPGTVHEVEEYQVPLQGVTHVELCIVPDIRKATHMPPWRKCVSSNARGCS